MTEEIKPGLESIIDLSTKLAEGFMSMAEGMNEFIQSVNKMPFMVRPFVKRDFKSSFGFELEEWQEFLRRLTARLEKIRDSAEAVKSGQKTLEPLREAATPFLERVGLVDEKVRAFQKYIAESPKKMEKAPKMFVNEEAREQMKRAPEMAKMIGEAADGLLELRDKLSGQV